MERFLLYLDDLDDVVFALAFIGERRRQALRTLIVSAFIAAIGALASIVAYHEPTLGAALLCIIAVILLYRSATSPYTAFARQG